MKIRFSGFFVTLFHNFTPAEQCDAKNENLGKKHVRKLIKDTFDFAEHHEQATLGLC